MPREDYEERKQARIDRLEARAAKTRQEATGNLDQARSMASVIPFGQPILIGHHSEKRDRNYRGKIDSKFRKGFEGLKAADNLDNRAAAAASNDAISADDPNAITKINSKLAEAVAERDALKDTNKKLRKLKIAVASLTDAELRDAATELMTDAGIPQEHIAELLMLARIGCLYGQFVEIPGYQITNKSANIRRMEQREKELAAQAEHAATGETKTTEYATCKVVENLEANRVQLIFPGKPSEAVRSLCKNYGFRWSPSEGAWQRQLNNSGIYQAHALAKRLADTSDL